MGKNQLENSLNCHKNKIFLKLIYKDLIEKQENISYNILDNKIKERGH